jgi:acyl-CoA thioester hydrolase
VRLSDLDERGVARAGVFFEYFQEARIRYLMDMHTRGERWSQHVVARTDLDYLAPAHHRQQPYSVHSWVGHLGSRSFTIQSEVRDDDRVLARATVVMVAFDMETQRTTEMTPAQRDRLENELS